MKPVGASYTAIAIQEMAHMVYSADDYLNRDFDHPMEITNDEGSREARTYAQKTMEQLRALHESGYLKLGIRYDRKCAITSSSVNDAGSNVKLKVKLDQKLGLEYINKCAEQQGIPIFTESQLRSIHCNGHWLRLFEQGEATDVCPLIEEVTAFLKELRSQTTAQLCKNQVIVAAMDLGIKIKSLTAQVEQRMFK